jgi:hypothetical protein
MDDGQNYQNPQPAIPPAGPSLYPTPTSGPLADHQMPPPAPQQMPAPAPATTNYNVWSIVIFVLLLLTFFTPLGSALFLPLVIVGIVGAVRQVNKSNAAGGPETTAKSVGVVIYKVLMGVCMVVGLGILAIMGFIFLIFAGGGGRMGS